MNRDNDELCPLPDPAEETIGQLPTWPDAALYKLARELPAELNRRRLWNRRKLLTDPVETRDYLRELAARENRAAAR